MQRATSRSAVVRIVYRGARRVHDDSVRLRTSASSQPPQLSAHHYGYVCRSLRAKGTNCPRSTSDCRESPKSSRRGQGRDREAGPMPQTTNRPATYEGQPGDSWVRSSRAPHARSGRGGRGSGLDPRAADELACAHDEEQVRVDVAERVAAGADLATAREEVAHPRERRLGHGVRDRTDGAGERLLLRARTPARAPTRTT